MSARRTVADFAVAVLLVFVTQGIGFAALVVAASRLGPLDFGAASFAIAVAGYFGLAANLGVGPRATRDIGADPDSAREIAAEALTLRILMTLSCAVALYWLAPLLSSDAATRALIPLAALALLCDGLNVEWALLGLRRPVLVAVGRFAGQAAYLPMIVILVRGDFSGARTYVLLTALSMLLTSVVCFALAWRRFGGLRLVTTRRRLARRFRSSVALGWSFLVGQYRLYASPIMLGYLVGASAVGQYTVAQKLPLALLSLVDLWFGVMIAQTAHTITSQPSAIRHQVGALVTLAACAALPLAAGAAIVGPDLMPRLFGEAFQPAGPVFVVLVWAIAVAATMSTLGSLLAARGKHQTLFWCISLGAIVTVVTCAVLAPSRGALGAAIAVLGGEATIAVALTIVTRRMLGDLPVDGPRVIGAGLATGLMCLVLLLIPSSVDPLMRIGIGAAVFTLGAPALGVIRRNELRLLVRTVRRDVGRQRTVASPD
jgi:O-antigen/teichoic acid export membrane protein